jgi:hypothetical protein
MLNPTTGNLLHSLRSFRNFRATAESFDLDRGGSGTAHNEAALQHCGKVSRAQIKKQRRPFFFLGLPAYPKSMGASSLFIQLSFLCRRWPIVCHYQQQRRFCVQKNIHD